MSDDRKQRVVSKLIEKGYRCGWQLSDGRGGVDFVLEGWVGGPHGVVIVQTYNNDMGVAVYVPATKTSLMSDLMEAL